MPRLILNRIPPSNYHNIETRFRGIEQQVSRILSRLSAIADSSVSGSGEGLAEGTQRDIIIQQVLRGGGSGGSIFGDVNGSLNASVVDAIKNVPFSGDPVTGDDRRFIVYDDTALQFQYSVIDKIQGKDIALPAIAQDRQVILWDDAADDYIYVDVTQLTPLGSWTSADISALGGTDVEIPNAWIDGTTNLANVLPIAGELVGIGVQLSGDVDGGAGAGNDLVVTAYIDGSSTALTVTVVGGAGTEDEAFTTVTPVSFSAGANLTVRAREVGSCAAVVAGVVIYGRFLP